jgi:hypothetical protein
MLELFGDEMKMAELGSLKIKELFERGAAKERNLCGSIDRFWDSGSEAEVGAVRASEDGRLRFDSRIDWSAGIMK